MAAGEDLTVAVLAGGRSSRMGQDKAGVLLGDRTLGERAVALARALSDDVRVLGHGRGMPGELPRIVDVAPERGPLGGLAALAATPTRARILVIPVDMPLLTQAVLNELLAALAHAPVAWFAETPLPAALRAAALAKLPPAGALHRAFAAAGGHPIPATTPDLLENINRFEDLDRASRRLGFL